MFKFILFLIISLPLYGAKQVAQVKLIRGEVKIQNEGDGTVLELNSWVSEGASIKTGSKSFVKLEFVDKSQMNIGPNSEMQIKQFSGDDTGVINFIKGQVRTQVTKDYLQMKDKSASKVIIKTANAIIGVRGTDFLVIAGPQTTSTVLFEGQIAFNKTEGRMDNSARALDQHLNQGVRIQPGEFSVVNMNQALPTIPSALNVNQLEKLENNINLDSGRNPSSSGASQDSQETTGSVVPKGLPGNIAASGTDSIGEMMDQDSSRSIASVSGGSTVQAVSQEAMGYVEGDKVKPANGSFLHLESGTVIPPAPDSIFDSSTNSFVSGTGNGSVLSNGSYVPPSNIEISNEGKISVVSTNSSGVVVKKEVKAIAPVVSQSSSLTTVAQTALVSNVSSAPIVVPTIIPAAPSGGIQGVNDPQRAAGAFTEVNFRIK